MEDRPRPDPIEIDVVSNDTSGAEDGGRWSRRRAEPWDGDANEVIVTGSSERQPGRPDREQRRWFAMAAIFGVVALLLGWLIGRAGGGGEVSTPSLTTPVTTEPVTSLPSGATLPSAATATTRPARTTTTTTLGALPLYYVDVDSRLAGVDVRLIGIEQERVLAELDLAEQTLVRRDVGSFSADPGSMMVAEDWVVLRSNASATHIVVYDDGSTEQVEFGGNWEMLPSAGTDRFWQAVEEDGWYAPTLYEEIDLISGPTGATIELPVGTWPIQSDPAGGLVVEAAGDLYSVDESSVDYLGPGELIGLSSEVVVTRDCDEQLRCGLSVTDRLTGDVRRVDLDPADGGLISGLREWFSVGGTAISPDGSMCALMQGSDDGMHLTLIDLRSGEVADLDSGGFLPFVVWSPDDRFALFLADVDDPDQVWGWGSDSGDLLAYDRATGDVFPVLSEPVEWQAVAARPERSGLDDPARNDPD